MIVVGSALVSALIMKFWPKTEDRSKRIQVMHRYQGEAASDLARIPQTPPLLQLVSEVAAFLVPVRARVVCGKLLRLLGA